MIENHNQFALDPFLNLEEIKEILQTEDVNCKQCEHEPQLVDLAEVDLLSTDS
jgi:hypothetical protein